MTIADLIARLEKATGPDRELDIAIARAVWPAGRFRDDNMARHEGTLPGCYTQNVNAADKLRPKGYGIRGCSEKEPGKFMCLISKRGGHGLVVGVAATPAIALCLASLKARRRGAHERDE